MMPKNSNSITPLSLQKNKKHIISKTLSANHHNIAPQFDLQERLQQLPHCPGVYHMLDKHQSILYIGKANSLKHRVRSYFHNSSKLSPRIAMMVSQVTQIEWQVTANEAEALVLENSHIKNLKPKFNILFRDDKSYPYLRFSTHSFPRISVYRGRSRRYENCFGPYPHSIAIKETMRALQKVFRLRTCSDSVFHYRTRPCLLYQIQRCSAPCVGHVSHTDYEKTTSIAIKYVQGLRPEAFEELDQAMQEAAQAQRYERAAELRDQLQALRITASSQRIIGHSDDYCDLVACVVDEGWFGLAFRRIHAGEPIEERTIAFQNPHGAQPFEIIAEFLRDQYINHSIPKKIWVSHKEESIITSIDERLQTLPVAKPRQKREKEWLERLTHQASTILISEKQTQKQTHYALKSLQDWLRLPNHPNRIECIDVSHLSGENTVASWVVFIDGRAHTSEYRRYNMHTVGGDDYAAIRELIVRRYCALLLPQNKCAASEHDNDAKTSETETRLLSTRTQIPLPDLLVVDGGVGQLSSVLSIVKQSVDTRLFDVPIIGLSKGPTRQEGEERIILADGQVLHSTLTHQGFRLLLKIRDEAHRFALTGQRMQRKKKNYSQLEEMSGVGPTRRKRLIARFGSILGVKMATVEQLQQVEGINKVLAGKIKEALNT